jgi:hypothetical protein
MPTVEKARTWAFLTALDIRRNLMKRLMTSLLLLVLASLACSLDYNPPPLSLTPVPGDLTSTPILVPPTLTSTPIPLSPTPVGQTATPMLPPTETLIPPTATSAQTGLTANQLRNATLTFTGSDEKSRTVTLQNGKYQNGAPGDTDYVVVMLGEKMAFGDLNADGTADAAITLAENYGGSGVFVSVVAVLNQAGQPNAVATALVDDRAMINDLAIKDGDIYLDATIHDINDAMCCPSLATKRNYRLINNELVLSRFSSKVPTGTERVITIDSPANGSEITGPFVVKGGVTVSPFENTLSYSVFIPGTKDPVAQAGFTISGDGLGGPGTFELPLDFTAAGFKGPIRIVIADISPADGSYLAVNTLFITLK